ncbi:MAG: hypothetical protein LWW98_03850 [Deltaproteobacteria bacterium]|nr:hypothetical protein [Deltaproteobacteria bacterium]
MHKKRFKKIQILLIPLILFQLLWLYACAVSHGPVFEKDGKKFGVVRGNFTDRWYDYYERALSYIDGGFYDEALFDLNVAIKKRPAEKRWTNTYGMHFMDYFPHRETGIIHYFLGNYDAAKSELELSGSQEPSAKARFYLDEVRKHIMLRGKKDISKPVLTLKYPQKTRDDPVTISGVAKDERYVSEIILFGEKILMESSDQMISFEKDLPLMQGRHKIEVIARNLLGGEEKQTIFIHVDRSGPVIIINKFVPGVVMQGYLYDESGIKSFIVNGTENNVSVDNNAFNVFLKPDMRNITLSAIDTLGNKTRANISPETITSKKRFKTVPRNLLLAQNFSDIADDSGSQLFLISNDRPGIILKGWPEKETVFKKYADIEVQVKGKTRIKELTIQVESKTGQYPAINKLRDNHKTGRIVSFNQSVSLEQGKNTIIVRAKDISGRESIKKIVITRQIPEVLRLTHRYAVKMCPFDSKTWKKEVGVFQRLFSGIPIFSGSSRFMKTENRALFQQLLLGSFISNNRFQVMVQKELQTYLNEYNFERIMVTPYERKGLKNPHALLLGNTFTDRNGIEVTARLVSLKTFEEIVTKDVYVKFPCRSALRSMAEELSEKFHNALPLMDGKINRITKKKIYAIFESEKTRQGWPIILYREQAPRYNPVTGISLGSDTEIIGNAGMGKNETIFVTTQNSGIRKGDKVINR